MEKFVVKAFTDAPLQITKKMHINSPISEVWDIVADHQGMTSWVPMISQVDLVAKDANGEWGEGCERHCQFGPDLLKEKIVYWNPPHGYAYTISDMHLVRDHLGHIALEESPQGTLITWRQYFEPNGNLVKNFIAKNIMMPSVMGKALKNLAKKVA